MSKIKKIIKSIMIDKSEKEYLSRKDKVVLVQIVRGYYEFSLLEKILKLEKITPDIKIIGLESKVVYFSFLDYILLIPFIAKSIFIFLEKESGENYTDQLVLILLLVINTIFLIGKLKISKN